MDRRTFIRNTAAATSLAFTPKNVSAAPTSVWLVTGPEDSIASSAPVIWASNELESALRKHRLPLGRSHAVGEVPPGALCIVAASASQPLVKQLLAGANVTLPSSPETLALITGKVSGKPVLLVAGADTRGLMYALLELADRIRYAAEPLEALTPSSAVIEQPANVVRSVTRCFVSEVEDKVWYNDRAMWPEYLSMLASHRFNRFSLAFGIGYDFTRQIRDCYFHFAYPFLFALPGYKVRAVPLRDGERERNFQMLKFIGEQTVQRGLQFQLGLWTHAYEWTDSPNANYTIEGLTGANHAAYCRDALYKVLTECPAISGVTFRVHGESGVAEGSYDFWKTLFDAIVRTGRSIEIDMHAKGMDDRMIGIALATGMPVKISPKFWAEHMGLPYHQASIRELEMPSRDKQNGGFFALSSGSRRFLRYGYGDLMTEDRRYGVLHRIWPGTQRTLLWGDPAFASAYGRAFSFCGSSGVEICEPLSFKGRKGSGITGGRCAYADSSLNPRYDWQKFLYTYRLWGRMLYNPNAEPESWRRYLREDYRNASDTIEPALAHASRILPLITTAHGPSAANNSYWPEMYTNMPIVDAAKNRAYSDTLSPKRFGAVSAFDPALFSRIDDFAGDLLSSRVNGKYSPIEVAQWLDDNAEAAGQNLARAESRQSGGSIEFKRLAPDIAIQAGIGRFFAAKLRTGVLYALFDQTGDRSALQAAIDQYKAARQAWAQLANRAEGVYVRDVTYGYDRQLRGHWVDRLPAIDDDLADMERKLKDLSATSAPGEDRVRKAVQTVLTRPRLPAFACKHTPVEHFRRGQKLDITLASDRPTSVSLHYRHVNQAETFQVVQMQPQTGGYRAAIPAEYTNSSFPLQYFFEVRASEDHAWIYPGLGTRLLNQPYFVVRQV